MVTKQLFYIDKVGEDGGDGLGDVSDEDASDDVDGVGGEVEYNDAWDMEIGGSCPNLC